MAKAKKEKLSLEELLEQALVKEEDRPYEVPGNWVWTSLEMLCTKITDGEHIKPKLSDYGIPLLTAKNILDGEIKFNNIDYVEENIAKKSWERCEPKLNDILVCSRGTIGRNTIVNVNTPFCLMGTVILLRLNSLVSSKFYNYVLKSEFMQDKMRNMCGSTAVSALYLKDIKKLTISLPPIAEQQRIVAVIESLFEKLDTAKELAQNALDSFENRKAAILHKAFTGELTAKWREENGVSLDEWEGKKIAETDIDIIDGDRGTNYPSKEEFSDKGYCLFLNAKNVTKNGFAFGELNFITKEKDELLRKGKLQRFDIILTTRGTIGNIAYFDESIPYEHMRINSGMVIYRGGSDFYKPFLYWLYKSNYIKNQIANIKTGSAQPQLPIKIMKDLKLIIPSLLEQKEIVRILDNLLDNEQRAKELCDVIEKIDLMKKAILSRAFRGELGTNHPEEESAVELLKEVLKEKI